MRAGAHTPCLGKGKLMRQMEEEREKTKKVKSGEVVATGAGATDGA
jgi:hypothetical protein